VLNIGNYKMDISEAIPSHSFEVWGCAKQSG
jgi:hypothetical protein